MSPFRIVIVGQGVAGAMAAAMFARMLNSDQFLVFSVPVNGADESVGSFGPIEVSDASIRNFHASLGLDDARLIRSTGASFGLGTSYVGWTEHHPEYFVPFGDIGAPVEGVAFHQHVMRLRAAGRDYRLGDFSVATQLARTGRFCRPSDDPNSPLSTFSYGLHLPKQPYARMLLDYAKHGGVEARSSEFRSAELNADGQVIAVILDDGARIEADLFVDASGPSTLLASQIAPASIESWKAWFPFDSTVHATVAVPVAPVPFNRVEAVPVGWRGSVPAMGRTGETLVYSSAQMSATDAAASLTSSVNGGIADITHRRFESGRRASPWNYNCIAIGAAAAQVEPLYPGSLMLVQRSLGRLLRLFPGNGRCDALAAEYNRETINELDRYRDFVALRYLLNGRAEAGWVEAREAEMSPELARKKQLYSSRGAVPLVDGDIFDEADWALLFDEHGVVPRRHDFLAEAIDEGRAAKLLDHMQHALADAASRQPLHGEYLMEVWERAAA